MYDYEMEMSAEWDAYCEALEAEENADLIKDDAQLEVSVWSDPENGPEYDQWEIRGKVTGRTYAWFELDEAHNIESMMQVLIDKTNELKKESK